MIKKKYLYFIIIILILFILGFINIPFFDSIVNSNNCNSNENSMKVYFRLGPISMPFKINKCDRG